MAAWTAIPSRRFAVSPLSFDPAASFDNGKTSSDPSRLIGATH